MSLTVASESLCGRAVDDERYWEECPESSFTVLPDKNSEPPEGYTEGVYSHHLRLDIRARKNAKEEKNNVSFIYEYLRKYLVDPNSDLLTHLKKGMRVSGFFRVRFWWVLADSVDEPREGWCACRKLLGVTARQDKGRGTRFSFRATVQAEDSVLKVFVTESLEVRDALSGMLGNRPRYRVALTVDYRDFRSEQVFIHFILPLRQDTHPVRLEEPSGPPLERAARRFLEALDRVYGLAAALGLSERSIPEDPRDPVEEAKELLRKQLVLDPDAVFKRSVQQGQIPRDERAFEERAHRKAMEQAENKLGGLKEALERLKETLSVLPTDVAAALEEATERAGELRSLLPPQLSDTFEQERKDIVDAYYRSLRASSGRIRTVLGDIEVLHQENRKSTNPRKKGLGYAGAVEEVLRSKGLYS